MNPLTLAVIAAGAMVNASLYFIFVFVTGTIDHNTIAIRAVIAAVGVTYLSFIAQLASLEKWYCYFLIWLSVGLGIAAGLLLLLLPPV